VTVVLITLLVVLGVASTVLLVYWGVGVARLVSIRRTLPTAASGRAMDAPDVDERVCIVIPAHDEASNVGALVRSIRAQEHEGLRAVLALDRCTDRTREIAESEIDGDDRFEIIEIEDCPADWAGKVNATWRGVTTSDAARTSDVLLFIDADVVLHPACLRATLALRRSRALDLLSLLTDVTTSNWWEWVVQPAAGFELMRQYPLARSNRQGFAKPFVNGQFIMIGRDAYERIGGHAAVHDEMLEDLAIGRLAAREGLACGAFFARGMVECRMYDSWEDFTRGWARIFAEAGRRRIRRLVRASVEVRTFGVVLPVAALAGVILGAASLGRVPSWLGAGAIVLGGASLGAWALTVGGAFRFAGLPWRSVVAYPVGAWLVGGVLARTARMIERRETTRWAGREYRLKPR